MSYAYSSDMMDRCYIADHANLRQAGDWTIGFTFRPDGTPGTDEIQTYVGKGNLSTNVPANYWAGYEDSGGTKRLRAGFMDTTATPVERSITYDVELTEGRFYSCKLAWDNTGKVLKLFLCAREHLGLSADTVYTQVATATFAGKSCSTGIQSLYFAIGVTPSTSTPADVTLTEVWLKSSNDTTTTYPSTRLVGNEANVVAYWRCDDELGACYAGGATLYDRGPDGPQVTWAMHSSDAWGGPDVTETLTWHPYSLRHLMTRPWQYAYGQLSITPATGYNGTLTGGEWSDEPTDLYYPGFGTVGMSWIGYLSGTKRFGATITGSDDEAGYEASTRLRSPRKAATCRTADAAGAKVYTVYFGASPAPVWALTVDNHNIATAAADGYVEIGTLEPWTCFEAPMPVGPEALGIVDLSRAVELPHGHRIHRELDTLPLLSMGWPELPRASGYELRRVLEIAGANGYAFACPDPRRQLYELGVYGLLHEIPAHRLADPGWGYTASEGLAIVGDAS